MPKPTPKPRRFIGVDVGLANTALAVVEGPGDTDVLALEFCGTEPNRALRQVADDHRRIVAIVAWFERRVVHWTRGNCDPMVIVEWFAPRFHVRRGWTTSIVVGALCATCQVLRVPHAVRRPPLEIQVARRPAGHDLGARAWPHALDALTHARLEWARREGRGG